MASFAAYLSKVIRYRCAGYARPPLGVPADLQSVAPDMFRSAGYVLSSVRRPGGYVIRRQKMT